MEALWSRTSALRTGYDRTSFENKDMIITAYGTRVSPHPAASEEDDKDWTITARTYGIYALGFSVGEADEQTPLARSLLMAEVTANPTVSRGQIIWPGLARNRTTFRTKLTDYCHTTKSDFRIRERISQTLLDRGFAWLREGPSPRALLPCCCTRRGAWPSPQPRRLSSESPRHK